MTYYPPPPNPYQPPQGPLGFDLYRQPGDALAPARRAAIMMWVLAALLVLCGVGLIVVFSTIDLNPLLAKSEQFYGPEMTSQMKASGMMNAEQMRLGGYFWGAVGIISAVLFGTFAVFVMRGRTWAIIAAIVVTSLLTLANLCSSLSGLVLAAKGGAAGIFVGCMMFVPLIVCGVLLYFLAQAARAAAGWKRMQAQMQSQYWQSMQQAAGGAPGYGYGYGAPPPPPVQPGPQQQLGPIPPPPGDNAPPQV